ncbi:MAG: 2-oxo acid dehydrogenase subunit E2 [Chloroflexi bacterium]|nr:2-oxo acid dehydrogenase subunit E2 [Chloroflexota bacterium]
MITEVILPVLGETMNEGTIVEWLKKEGDPVERGEVLFMVETDKATLEVEAPARGFLRQIVVPTGQMVPVLTVVGLITSTMDESLEEAEEQGGRGARESTSAPPLPSTPARIFASPRARRLAREKGVDLALVTSSGPDGRIVERDVVTYLETLVLAPPLAPTPPAPPALAEAVEAIAEVPLTGVRAVIARRMGESHQTTAPVTLTTEADATAFVELRERLKAALASELGFDIGYNDLLIRVVAHALRQFPYMNARLDGECVRHLREIHIALAVDTDRGLLAPVIRNADRKGVAEIAREVRGLAESARAGKALPDELSGSTFTITNLGMHEIDAFTPIINLPEAAILGVGRIKARPAVVEGELCVRQTMWLSLTFDHRLVDGAPAARFLQRIKQLIENPYLLLG